MVQSVLSGEPSFFSSCTPAQDSVHKLQCITCKALTVESPNLSHFTRTGSNNNRNVFLPVIMITCLFLSLFF